MAVKYKTYLQQMYDSNPELFNQFDKLHQLYQQDKAKYQNQYNLQGKDVVKLVEEWESKLCARMERGQHSNYSHNLADKFRQELKKRYPLIDFVGVKIEKPATLKSTSPTTSHQSQPKTQRLEDMLHIPRITFET